MKTDKGFLMEELLDNIWFKILDLANYFVSFLNIIFMPLNALGPVFAISVIAFITVAIAKILTKKFKTKRYKKLEQEFNHWHGLRREAMKYEDPEKARLLAKNIDQAKLNQVYYNYFFEGFMLGLATKYLPIFIFLAYVNETYKAANLKILFGREYIFMLPGSNGKPVVAGSVFWFITSIVLIYIAWFAIEKIFIKRSGSIE